MREAVDTDAGASADGAIAHKPHPKALKNAILFNVEKKSVASTDFDALASDWGTLSDYEHNIQPFFQPYWFASFCRTFLNDQSTEVVTVRDGLGLRGVLPLMRKRTFFGRIPANTLRSLSGIHSCRFDFICSQAERESIALAAWNALKNDETWTVCEALNVPQGGSFEAIMQHALRDGFLIGTWPTLLSPYLTLPSAGASAFSNCPERYKPDRKRLDRYYRKLQQSGVPRFEVSTKYDDETFQAFLDLEGGGWKGKNGGAITCSPLVKSFYREVLSRAASHGQLRICTLKLGEQRIAMELAFVTGNRCYSPKIAYDERFSNCAPGQLLIRHVIEDLAAQGVKSYDLLGPRARHKLLWAGDTQSHSHCYIFRPNIQGRLCHLASTRIAPQIRSIKYAYYGDPQSLVSKKKKPPNNEDAR
jgi:CelD/BcsL family acetyltransferase involved in cellulose biosynthesis